MIDLQQWLRIVDGSQKIIDKNKIDYDQKIVAKDLQITTITQQYNSVKELLASTQEEDKKTIANLQSQLALDPQEIYWNNRFPKINRSYEKIENGKSYYIDVRNFIMLQDANIPKVSGNSNDEKALLALSLVIGKITYTSDKSIYGYDEYWAYWFETWGRKVGDCEDGAILLYNILLASGVPYWRVRLNAGNVNGGGHAYVTYCRETDNQFVVLDWCYWPNRLPMKDRKLHKDEQNYNDVNKNFYIWFSWNQKYCFGNMQTMIDMPKELQGGKK